MSNKKGGTFTKNEYEVVKKLANAGLTNREIMGIVDRSEFTVQQAKKAETWQEYEANRAKRTAQLRAKDPRIKSNKKVEFNEDTNRYEEVNHTNEAKFVNAVVKLTDAVNRLCELLEEPTPLEKEAKAFKLFNRG